MSKNKKLLSQMNVVPFIDIMFVLLIIFIMSSSTIYSDYDIAVPDVKSEISNKNKDVDIIFIDEDLNIKYKGEFIEINNLNEVVSTSDVIRLGFDESIRYREVSILMEKLREEGYVNISLVFQVI